MTLQSKTLSRDHCILSLTYLDLELKLEIRNILLKENLKLTTVCANERIAPGKMPLAQYDGDVI